MNEEDLMDLMEDGSVQGPIELKKSLAVPLSFVAAILLSCYCYALFKERPFTVFSLLEAATSIFYLDNFAAARIRIGLLLE